MLQVLVLIRSLYFKAAVVTKKLVACGNQYVVTVECNTAQAPVGAAAFEVNFARVPVDVLLNFLFLSIRLILLQFQDLRTTHCWESEEIK